MPPQTPTPIVHFLLIEDDDDHACLVQRAFDRHRVVNAITRVANGEQALDFLARRGAYRDAPRPDVVLLDLKLPGMSGHDVLRELKSNPEWKSIPAVVLSTSPAEADRARAYASSANSYLVKPLDFEQFQALIDELQLYWAVWNAPPPAPPGLGTPHAAGTAPIPRAAAR